ncbi:MAG: phospho-N-acetylmuramoyl-pentapeptide-transferase [Anaerolineaceae bacterium]|nr:phospho-N-acetylmuramoyl-pentapeptide-transferase [Anaerolineaceae bacterium]
MNGTTTTLAIAGLSFLLTVIWGMPFLYFLRRLKIGKLIRADGPEVQFSKMGTPTMGGFLFIFPTVLINLLLNAANMFGVHLIGQSYIIPMMALVLYSVIGAVDDWEGIRGSRRGLGMSAKMKFGLQVLLSVFFAYIIKNNLGISDLIWPNSPYPINVGFWFYPIAIFLIVGTSNAVNLTDGMDGLAGLICATAFAAYGIITLKEGDIFISRFCFILVGALFGFLWFNVNPAMMFMGDAGSLSLGATLAVVALISRHWLVLPIIAIIPVSETLSVILQVAYFKFTHGKRLFRMAPIHHHFQAKGWSEMQVVQRFWLISLLFAMLGVGLASL